MPKDSADAFTVLAEAGIIEASLATSLKKMVDFRNIAVHDYTSMNVDVIRFIVQFGTQDIRHFMKIMYRIED